MRVGSTDKEIDGVLERLKELGFKGSLSRGVERTVVGVVGQTYPELADELAVLEGVADVVPVSRPYKLASREFKPEDTVIRVGNVAIGGGNTVIMAGQCSVDTEEQMMATARVVKKAGGHILRGGAFKPRTNPYAFRGLGEKGLQILAAAKAETGLPIISEVMDPRDVELVARYADILQVGSRSMQNFSLLDEVGRSGKPVMLKRGMWAPLQEWLLAAEYVLAQENSQVMLCERGIRTFETSTRFTMDLSVIPAVKRLSHLPIIGDPSHATGHRYLVEPMAMAAVAAGADGLIIEVHPHPSRALSDGVQSLRPEAFARLMSELQAVARAVGREM